MATGTSGLKSAAAPAGRIDMRTTESQQRARADRFKERSAKAHEQTETLANTREKWKEALASGDIDTLKIVNADFETAARQSAQNSKDLSQMMFAVLEGYKDIGVTIKAAEEFNADEKSIQSSANDTLEKAKGQLVQAQGMQWNLFGRRDKAITAAKEAITVAEAAVVMAKQEVEAMRRQRLNSMDLTQSMQLQQAITQELTDVAQDRIAEIESNLTIVQQNVTLTMDTIKTDTAQMEELDKSLGQLNAELGNLNTELGSYVENSSDWQDCRDRILQKTRQRDDVEADRNAAFMRAQEGQRFIEFNKMEEQGQVQLLSQHKTWISLLQMGTQQRDILYSVHLGLLRGAADQEAMSMVDQVATETDERMVVDAAMKTQSMRKNTLDRLKRMPDQVRRLREVTSAEVQNQADFERQFTQAIDEFHKNFGTEAGYDTRDAHRSPAA